MGWAQTAQAVGTGWVVADRGWADGESMGWAWALPSAGTGWVVAEVAAGLMAKVTAAGAATAARAGRAP